MIETKVMSTIKHDYGIEFLIKHGKKWYKLTKFLDKAYEVNKIIKLELQ